MVLTVLPSLDHAGLSRRRGEIVLNVWCDEIATTAEISLIPTQSGLGVFTRRVLLPSFPT